MLRCTVISQLMSQSGHRRTLITLIGVSALPPKADMVRHEQEKSPSFDHFVGNGKHVVFKLIKHMVFRRRLYRQLPRLCWCGLFFGWSLR